MTNGRMDSLGFSVDKIMVEGNAVTLTEKLDLFEKRMILCALRRSKSVTQAAKLMKVSKQRLHYKIEKHQIPWRDMVRTTEHSEEDELLWKMLQNQQSYIEMLEAYERELILDALKNAINAKTAADHLGLSKQALNYKLNKYHVKEK